MRLLNTENFIEEMNQRGIGFDKRYSPPYCLTYQDASAEESRAYLDEIGSDLIRFLDDVVTQIEPWNSGWLWKRIPKWDYESSTTNKSKNSIWRVLIHEGFIPVGFSGAIEFEEKEKQQLVRVLFAQATFGMTTYDDVFFIPNHVGLILYCDHHRFVDLDFKEAREKEKFLQTEVGKRFFED